MPLEACNLYAVCAVEIGTEPPCVIRSAVLDLIMSDKDSAEAYYADVLCKAVAINPILMAWHPLRGLRVLRAPLDSWCALSPHIAARGCPRWLERLCLAVANVCAAIMAGACGEWHDPAFCWAPPPLDLPTAPDKPAPYPTETGSGV